MEGLFTISNSGHGQLWELKHEAGLAPREKKSMGSAHLERCMQRRNGRIAYCFFCFIIVYHSVRMLPPVLCSNTIARLFRSTPPNSQDGALWMNGLPAVINRRSCANLVELPNCEFSVKDRCGALLDCREAFVFSGIGHCSLNP